MNHTKTNCNPSHLIIAGPTNLQCGNCLALKEVRHPGLSKEVETTREWLEEMERKNDSKANPNCKVCAKLSHEGGCGCLCHN